MGEYRREAREVAREARWTFWRFLPLFLTVVVGLSAVSFGLYWAGVFGGTVVERKVFENSYQRQESVRAQIATDEVVLTEIERKFKNPNLDQDTRVNLEAQAAAARVRIETAKRRLR